MHTKSIMDCIELITDELPTLRDRLNLTQREFAEIIGISRQSVIDLEHKNRKITKSILVTIITYFSLRRETAYLLYQKGLYDMEYARFLGYTAELMRKIYDLGCE